MTFDSRAFRDTLGCFATGVTVVTTVDPDGQPVGITVNSFASVSLDPPLVLFSLDRRSRRAGVLADASHFVVHILGDEQSATSRAFANHDAAAWDRIAWRPGVGGCPIIEGDLATLQCAVHARHDGGDHLIVVGRVLQLRAGEGDPLLYFRGRYRAIAPMERAPCIG